MKCRRFQDEKSSGCALIARRSVVLNSAAKLVDLCQVIRVRSSPARAAFYAYIVYVYYMVMFTVDVGILQLETADGFVLRKECANKMINPSIAQVGVTNYPGPRRTGHLSGFYSP